MTSSLTQIDKKNNYLKLKAKLFGGSINDLIQNKYMVNIIRTDDVRFENIKNILDCALPTNCGSDPQYF